MEIKMPWFLAMLLFVATSLCNAGSPCPERELIYPCHCASIPINKKTSFTIVTCRQVPDTDSLSQIWSFQGMQIDQFVLYDSFWEINKKDTNLDIQRRLPEDWLPRMNIKHLEIIDTHLSDDFACGIKSSCPNRAIKHLSIRNSSSSGMIYTQCKRDSSSVVFWTSCLNMLETFTYSYTKLNKFDKSVFPVSMPMQSLHTLNLSHNEIQTIGDSAFTSLVKLRSLDLSYNKISRLLSGIFGNNSNVLEFIDLSNNYIKSLPADLFKYAPFLVTFAARENQLPALPEEEWKYLGDKLKMIDLRDNPVVCDCHMIWINCTLHVNTVVLGLCSNENYTETPLRRASIYMSQRCESNVIVNREKGKEKNACPTFIRLKIRELGYSRNDIRAMRDTPAEIPQVPQSMPKRRRSRGSSE